MATRRPAAEPEGSPRVAPPPITSSASTPERKELRGGDVWDALRSPERLTGVPTAQIVDELLPMAERHAPEMIRWIRLELEARERAGS